MISGKLVNGFVYRKKGQFVLVNLVDEKEYKFIPSDWFDKRVSGDSLALVEMNYSYGEIYDAKPIVVVNISSDENEKEKVRVENVDFDELIKVVYKAAKIHVDRTLKRMQSSQ